jgi:hypothetical protein
MMRHFIKPGYNWISKLKGCIGEIETERDMVNRDKI